eukprot:1143443-Pelagomonas_calceolata.AAC.5
MHAVRVVHAVTPTLHPAMIMLLYLALGHALATMHALAPLPILAPMLHTLTPMHALATTHAQTPMLHPNLGFRALYGCWTHLPTTQARADTQLSAKQQASSLPFHLYAHWLVMLSHQHTHPHGLV